MNAYDFDGTIYQGDSTKDFYWFCLVHNPRVMKALPIQIKGIALYLIKVYTLKDFKTDFYSFLKYLDNWKESVELFWNKYSSKVGKWYIDQKREEDLIISASPEFLLKPICENLGVKNLIATKIDPFTGKHLSENCKGEEKIIRFRKRFPDETIDHFYFDSKSDLPMCKLAKFSHNVRK